MALRDSAGLTHSKKFETLKIKAITARSAMLFRALAERVERLRFVWIALAISCVYTLKYLKHPALRGTGEMIEAWWDQGNYLRSARAFASLNLSPDAHWYPPGYALTAVPFATWMGSHAFFFPDLLFLIASAWIFIRICRFFDVGKIWALLAFGLGVFGSRFILDQYVIPWTTTPAMTLLLAICLLYLQSVRSGLTPARGVLIGAALVGLAVTRPTDILCVVPFVAHIAILIVGQTVKRERRLSDVAGGVAAVILTVVVLTSLAVVLHWRIYGWALSPYSTGSAQFGLDPYLMPFRFYVLFISPTGFYGEGRGIIAQYPPIAIGLIALIYCIVFLRRYWALPVSVLAYICIYLSYPDFLPTGLWRYQNFHYLKWTLPMMGLFTILMAKDLSVRKSKAGYMLIALLLACGALIQYRAADLTTVSNVRIDDKRITAELPEAEWIVGGRIDNATGGFDAINLERGNQIVADGVVLRHIFDFRMVPVGNQIFFVLNHPIKARSLTVSFDPNMKIAPAMIAPDARLVPVQGEFHLRPLSDWKRPPNEFAR